ncbi:vegetative cell wall protein gp1-like [Vitis vinifera]|uniref:vegetative cell wall protein gp1-like n=1 Tax=Vitis vinifera TaxID=29760 RepID=UPI002882FEC3|nr:vegetative cell wall protein gp1-like [Vitis vinifera]
MTKTRGGLSASPSSPTPRPQRAAMGAAPSPPVQAPAIPPSKGEAPSQRRYPTRRPPADPVPPVEQATSPVSRPPAKRSRFSDPGEPSHAPQPQPATEEPRIPVDMPPEAIIRRPMIAGPPIEELPRVEQIPQAQQDEILTETPPPTPAAHPSVHMPEAIHSTSPITQGAPPTAPATPAPPPPSEPTVTISLTEFRGLELGGAFTASLSSLLTSSFYCILHIMITFIIQKEGFN